MSGRLLAVLALTGCYNRTLYEERFEELQPEAPCPVGLWYLDGDGDGFGGQAVAACEAPGQVAVGGDCDDGDAAVNPDATEVTCNGVDEDCDPATPDAVDLDEDGFDACVDCNDADDEVFPGQVERCNDRDDDCDAMVDENAFDATVAFQDLDGDGVGSIPIVACDAELLGVHAAGDCDDTDASVFPGAVEDCDPVDRDCDGDPTLGTPIEDLPLWYADLDGDGLGSEVSTQACEAPEHHVAVQGDCDDHDPALLEPRMWYVDADLDGYGTDGVEDCLPVPGRIMVGGDCDDSNPVAHPHATEHPADGVDADCDGFEACWEDGDHDGYGGALVPGPLSCTGIGGDCDDTDPHINPAAPEIANDGTDANCDEDDRCFADADGDGFGAGGAVACGPGTGPKGDCDDAVATVYPGAPEVVGDSIDQDCDGLDACYADADGDGFGIGTAVPAVPDCSVVASWARLPGDCAPSNGDEFPGAPEIIGDGVDQDCDGFEACYPDLDGDGVGAAPAVPVEGSVCEGHFTTVAGDCADQDPSRRPGAPEIAGDGIDQDCDGLDQCFLDADGDGYGAVAIPALACVGDLTALDDDCDDTRADVNPDALEVAADGLDNDCDSIELCYLDTDGDGYGTDQTVASPNLSCDDPDEAPLPGDCAPEDPLVYPGLLLERQVPGEYPTIPDAIAAACASDRILIGAGSWPEPFTVDRALRLIGVGQASTVIEGRVQMSTGSLESLMLRGGVGLNGGCLETSGPVDLIDVSFEACAAETGGGAWLAAGSSWTRGEARSNTATTGGGVWLQDAVTVEGVRFVDNDADAGAAVAGAGENVLTTIEVLDNVGGSAVWLNRGVIDGAIVAGNSGDGVVLTAFDGADLTLSGNGGTGLVAAGATRAESLILSHNGGYGLQWSGPQASPFSDSLVFGNALGPVDGLSSFVGTHGVEAVEPLFVLFPTTLPRADWDLHLRDEAAVGGHAGPFAVDAAYYDDLDQDGLFDGYELICGLAVGSDDAAGDADADTLTNLEELAAGTRADRADTDGDGVDDATELLLGSDPRSAP